MMIQCFFFQLITMLLILFMLLSLLGTSTASFPITINFNMSNCYNSSLYDLNSTFETNFNQLLSSLVSRVSSAKNGLLKHKQGQDNQDPVYGLALCRGDLYPNECHECIQMASNQIKSFCPRATQAILWKEPCMIQYSNQSFFSLLQEQPSQALFNENKVTNQVQDWITLIKNSLDEITTNAASSTSSKMYDMTEVWYSPMTTNVFTMAQCTPDLSTENCTKCFSTARSQLNETNRVGGIMLMPSCTLRYEAYQFTHTSNSTRSMAPPPTSTVTKNREKKASTKKIVVAVIVPIAVLGIIITGICFFRKKAKKYSSPDVKNVLGDLTTVESLMFDLKTLEAATNNFSNNQILGQGGFGSVYKGTLANGQEIAVKRLSKISGQGVEEFKNEVVLIANLQHRNLVKLLGFCLAGEEKLLVYEFVPNKSLNYFLFDARKQGELNWSTRYEVIRGIARGLLYLHEDSRPRIIHRDLKSGNILLDANMNPKIADFGLARIFKVEQTVDDTSRVVGTYGYMAPEYAMHGQFSVKSDVYSFGVLVLEIVSGKKISTKFHQQGDGDLLTYAWRSLNEEKPLDFMDSTLKDTYSSVEVLRCIHLGLWCAQENTNGRPTMSTVVHLLNNDTTTNTMPTPPHPRIFYNSSSTESSLLSRLSVQSTTSTSNTSESKPLYDQNQITVSEMLPR
ncbi:cysteine-rich receptor-like protein kinase 5 [Chenopodium quinoa]|uniref:cysteine-rich receptor-like protein kinase 5 n=1 Tax=Chenopodium quinoa TaxID=63459 RepID=UPI000B76FBAF|nr:cysteine-rich receptor-like protein kinase 5 [Chenopodium quinoa]